MEFTLIPQCPCPPELPLSLWSLSLCTVKEKRRSLSITRKGKPSSPPSAATPCLSVAPNADEPPSPNNIQPQPPPVAGTDTNSEPPSITSSPLTPSPYQRHTPDPLTMGVEVEVKPVETTTPQLRSRSLSFRRRGPKGELARASKRDSKGGSSPNPIASPSPIPSGGGSGPEARAARSARWGGAGAASSPVGARGSIQSRLSRLSPLTSVSSKGVRIYHCVCACTPCVLAPCGAPCVHALALAVRCVTPSDPLREGIVEPSCSPKPPSPSP